MILIPADIEIDGESIIAQMDRVRAAQDAYEEELQKLRKALIKAQIKEKRGSQEPL